MGGGCEWSYEAGMGMKWRRGNEMGIIIVFVHEARCVTYVVTYERSVSQRSMKPTPTPYVSPLTHPPTHRPTLSITTHPPTDPPYPSPPTLSISITTSPVILVLLLPFPSLPFRSVFVVEGHSSVRRLYRKPDTSSPRTRAILTAPRPPP